MKTHIEMPAAKFLYQLGEGDVFRRPRKASRYKVLDPHTVPDMVQVIDENGKEELLPKRMPVTEIRTY